MSSRTSWNTLTRWVQCFITLNAECVLRALMWMHMEISLTCSRNLCNIKTLPAIFHFIMKMYLDYVMTSLCSISRRLSSLCVLGFRFPWQSRCRWAFCFSTKLGRMKPRQHFMWIIELFSQTENRIKVRSNREHAVHQFSIRYRVSLIITWSIELRLVAHH